MSAELKVPYTGVHGWVLQHHRASAGFSQAGIAREMGMTQSGWAKIEKGLVPINSIQLHLFAQKVGQPTQQIHRDVDHLVARLRSEGREVSLDRPPPKAADSLGKFILGAGLAALLVNLMLRGDD